MHSMYSLLCAISQCQDQGKGGIMLHNIIQSICAMCSSKKPGLPRHGDPSVGPVVAPEDTHPEHSNLWLTSRIAAHGFPRQ